jgi:sugar phosphate isomerase/epimerase
MKIATTTADFKDYVARDDVAGAIKLLAKCGFRHLDISLDQAFFDGSAMCSENWREWAEGIRRAGVDYGVDFVQAHASDGCFVLGPERDRRLRMLKREMEICRILGIPGMVVHAVYSQDNSREEFMEANVNFYRELLPTAEETGVRIYTENTCRQNCPTYFLFDSTDLNELRQRLDNHPLFGFCWDVGHANCHPVDQYEAIMTMGEGLMAVHVHDSNFGCDMHLAPLTGTTSYDAVINGLLDVGFKGYFTLEAFSIPIPFTFCNCHRKHFTHKSPEFERLMMLPLEFKLRSETLMLDTVRYMLDVYNCLEE